jgi:putative ABC transport system substrate-binding protein
MRRREFIALFGGASAAWPLAVRAQQPARPVIGFLNSETAAGYAYLVAAFRDGLNRAGFVDGQNVTIEFRWAEGNNDQLPRLAEDLVKQEVSVLAALGAPAARSAKAATAKIPVVFLTADDAVGAGLVTSLNRPAGNMTGVSLINVGLVGKRLELLRELFPRDELIAVLVNPKNPSASASIKDAQDAANAVKQEIRILYASTIDELGTVFRQITDMKAGALLVTADPFFIRLSGRLAELAAASATPAIHVVREFPAAGGLMSYGTNLADEWREVGIYTGRVLKGEKPADLPVVLPTKFQLVINLKTAKALGLTVPLALLTTADEVIE